MPHSEDKYFSIRSLIGILSVILSLHSLGQRNIEGVYKDFSQKRIKLFTDSIYYWSDFIDIYGYWQMGKWSMTGDTIFFRPTLIYDTLRTYKKDGSFTEEVFLSNDKIPERFLPVKFERFGGSGGQRTDWFPTELFHKGRNLFEIKNGRLLKKKFRLKPGAKKIRPGFFRMKNQKNR